MVMLLRLIVSPALFLIAVSVLRQGLEVPNGDSASDSLAPGKLIPGTETMQRGWDFPRNPMTDSLPADARLAEQVRYGFRLFIDTPHEAPRLSRNRMACTNCHLNGGQREKALPLVGVAGVFPEYNKRAGRVFSLEDRIVGCFTRSQDAAQPDPAGSAFHDTPTLPTTHSKEVLALSAYITWLSAGYPAGTNLPWRGQNVILRRMLIPIDNLDPKRGEKLFMDKCTSCHGKGGMGVAIGDKKAGPLWGRYSWNDGAGAARIYTLAGMIRYTMPYLDPGSLTDEEAQQISAFINSKPRPKYRYKGTDYPSEPIPPDAVYYQR